MAADGEARLPRRREPDLAHLAAFQLSPAGQVTSWSVTATALFRRADGEVAGRDVCDVLMTGPGQRQLVQHALAEVAAGRVWTATVAGGELGEGRFALRFEPAGGPPGSALVIAQRASPQPSPGWLSQAAARIGSTLDLPQTAAEIVDAAVPGLADGAVLYVAERILAADEVISPQAGHGAVVRRLAGRLPGQDAAAADDLEPGQVLVLGAGTPAAQAMITGQPVLFDQLDGDSAERLNRFAGSPDAAASFTCFLAVPLTARGMVLGCAVFGRVAASPAFSPSEATLAGELASHAALAIDNARLYQRERRTALALQRGLLPWRPQIPAGLEVAQAYLPVGASVVGGDWHDIVPLPGGRAALLVGDAMGHGPEAAAVMAQLRTAAHILAGLELPPGEILSRLDQMAAGMAVTAFATCLCLVVDPAGGCVAARAGHLPPMLVLPGGRTQLPDIPAGLPLGLGAESVPAAQVSVPPGATIAMFTDGLVESRTQPIDDGLAALGEALSAALAQSGDSLSEACRGVTRKLAQHGEDDITLVLARVRPAALSCS